MTKPSSHKTQYDTFASQYASMEDLPSEIVATHLLRNAVAKGPHGVKVLDLACGTGTYARMLLEMGVAEHVVGVDVSSGMVQTGEAMEAKHPGPARIEFHVADCVAPLDHLGLERASFDLVMGNWLFNYASSRAELVGMWRNVVTYLKPGGRFVGLKEGASVEDHFSQDFKYGIRRTVTGQVEDGLKVHVEANTEPKIEFDGYSLEARLYEEVPVDVGMTEVMHRKPSAEDLPDVAGENLGFWEGYLENPLCVLGMAVKAE
jgi:ubiquinone/menaquinone biosynthesis C-methylase UbiE